MELNETFQRYNEKFKSGQNRKKEVHSISYAGFFLLPLAPFYHVINGPHPFLLTWQNSLVGPDKKEKEKKKK